MSHTNPQTPFEKGGIAPHGGTLINRLVTAYDVSALPTLEVNERNLADLELIATGVYSPLTGFMNQADYDNVVENMRLANGLPWGVPINLGVSKEVAEKLSGKVALTANGKAVGTLTITDKYTADKLGEAKKVYKAEDAQHPGVAAIFDAGEVYIGGDIELFEYSKGEFPSFHFTPTETRKKFADNGWKTIVAFQTRNPIHRAHEYLHKVALEQIDGLFLNPLVGATKSDDVPAETRMQAYEVLLENYYPSSRVLLGVYPAAMRYAGPREAITHAISRKNYGCTHFIVGRDHAGVGSYYGTYDAQEIFDNYSKEEIGIEIIKFEHTFYCKKCQAVVSSRTCPCAKENHLVLSGTKVRELLRNGENLPAEFSRPEVAEVLRAAYAKAEAIA